MQETGAPAHDYENLSLPLTRSPDRCCRRRTMRRSPPISLMWTSWTKSCRASSEAELLSPLLARMGPGLRLKHQAIHGLDLALQPHTELVRQESIYVVHQGRLQKLDQRGDTHTHRRESTGSVSCRYTACNMSI